MSRRFKKDYSLDGWPVSDSKVKSILNTDDLVNVLNNYDHSIKLIKSAVDSLPICKLACDGVLTVQAEDYNKLIAILNKI